MLLRYNRETPLEDRLIGDIVLGVLNNGIVVVIKDRRRIIGMKVEVQVAV
jgi:hypothetical protein